MLHVLPNCGRVEIEAIGRGFLRRLRGCGALSPTCHVVSFGVKVGVGERGDVRVGIGGLNRSRGLLMLCLGYVLPLRMRLGLRLTCALGRESPLLRYLRTQVSRSLNSTDGAFYFHEVRAIFQTRFGSL